MSGDSPLISVGIPTDGMPVLEQAGSCVLLKNMLIGKDFHWQRVIEALLPGEVAQSDDPVFRVVNRLPVETYLKCVVGSEMNPEAPVEFLKAHSVISRSWALGKMRHIHSDDEEGKVDDPDRIVNWEDTCDHLGFDVCSDDHCQRYQGMQPIAGEVRHALGATEGMVLCDAGGRLVDARFSKCCGGHTEVFSSCWQNREEACLQGFVDPWCDLLGMTPEKRHILLVGILKDYDRSTEGGYRWDALVDSGMIEENLRTKFGKDVGRVEDIGILERGVSGRAVRMLVKGSRGEIEIGKELMIRRLLAASHLYSSWFDIEKMSGTDNCSDRCRPGDNVISFHLRGRGWRHGVGLCQIGAARMAFEGYDYPDILSFYYPGSRLFAAY